MRRSPAVLSSLEGIDSDQLWPSQKPLASKLYTSVVLDQLSDIRDFLGDPERYFERQNASLDRYAELNRSGRYPGWHNAHNNFVCAKYGLPRWWERWQSLALHLPPLTENRESIAAWMEVIKTKLRDELFCAEHSVSGVQSGNPFVLPWDLTQLGLTRARDTVRRNVSLAFKYVEDVYVVTRNHLATHPIWAARAPRLQELTESGDRAGVFLFACEYLRRHEENDHGWNGELRRVLHEDWKRVSRNPDHYVRAHLQVQRLFSTLTAPHKEPLAEIIGGEDSQFSEALKRGNRLDVLWVVCDRLEIRCGKWCGDSAKLLGIENEEVEVSEFRAGYVSRLRVGLERVAKALSVGSPREPRKKFQKK